MVAIFGSFKAEFSGPSNFAIAQKNKSPASRATDPAGFKLCA
jgi:hypothetical protein